MNFSQQSPPPTSPTPPKPQPTPTPPTSAQYGDPLEQRDPWRTLWNFATHDGVLFALVALIALALLLAIALPQTPAGGTAEPIAYAQWQSQARASTGVLYRLVESLGLFEVLQSAWFKLLLALLAGASALRLANDVARMRLADMPAVVLRDELRLRVTNRAPTLPDMVQRLRQLRYRVIATSIASHPPAPDASEWLHANRAPLAEALSALFHAGILVTMLGLLLNFWLGWQASYVSVAPNQPANLPSGRSLGIIATSTFQTNTLALQLQPNGAQAQLHANERASLDGVNISLRQITPGLHVSATQAGQPITVTISNYSVGRRDALLSFATNDRERAFVLPAASLLARVVISSEDALGTGQLQAFALGSGALITDTALQAQMTISDTTLRFAPDTGGIIDAEYRPGTFWIWLGLALALMGLVSSLLYPVQRLVVRHHGHWTEFYGSGRQIRHTITQLLSLSNTSDQSAQR